MTILLFLLSFANQAQAKPPRVSKPQIVAVSSDTLRLALIEDNNATLALAPLAAPLERIFRQSRSSASVVDVRMLPCYYSGSDFRLRFPSALALNDSSQEAIAVETEAEVALIYPPAPTLLEALRKNAADPSTYRLPWSIDWSSKTLSLSQAVMPDGDGIVTALLDPKQGESAIWHSGAATLYRLKWEGADVSVVLIAKAFGGLGRVAQAARSERRRGPLLGVARGDVFGNSVSELQGRALAETLYDLGLRYSAVDDGDLRNWKQLQAYEAEHPDGIRFLSANLVYSTAPAVSYFPDHEIVDAAGMRVALVGITPPSAAKYLDGTGPSGLTVIDPIEALRNRLTRIRAGADLVVLLVDLKPGLESLRRLRGVDLVLGEREDESVPTSRRPQTESRQTSRPVFDEPLRVARVFDDSFNLVELRRSRGLRGFDWDLVERHLPLDETMPVAGDFEEFDPQSYGVELSTAGPLIPAARRIFDVEKSTDAFPAITARQFWTMAAGLLADETGAEIGLLNVWPLPIPDYADVGEGMARAWLRSNDPIELITVSGAELKSILSAVAEQARREREGLPEPLGPAIAAGGMDADGGVHGLPVVDGAAYRVAISRPLAAALGLAPAGREQVLVVRNSDQLVLDALKKRAGAPPESYRAWMEGRAVRDRGLWRVNFRDISLNLSETQVARSDAFDAVPNSRIQGFNQVLVGGDLKTDVEYFRDPFKWTNTIEMEYAKSRLAPRGQPVVTNTTADRIMFLTKGTERAGRIPLEWLAKWWGPSLGLQYDGQFEQAPGLPRKQVYSAFPGVELYDGTFVKSWVVSGAVQRDQSRQPPNTQFGAHTRAVASDLFGVGKAARLDAEFYANYYWLTHSDLPQDLRFEGDLNFKLHIPIRRYLTIAPFFDYYLFALKTQPLWGHSVMMGISIGFSRVWKPQYESF